MRLTSHIVRWTLLLSMLAVFAGCGDSLLGPPPTGGSGTGSGGTEPQPQFGPEILVVHPDGTTSWTQPPMDWTPNMGAGLLGDGARATVTAVVDGLLGGKMQCGRFFLYVPPGSFLGPGTITMSTIDSTIMICDVEIHPARLNLFRKPVRLYMSTTGALCSTDSLTMYWFNPETKKWVDMGADKNLSDNPECLASPYPSNMSGIVTNLSHFSRYGGGKAGW